MKKIILLFFLALAGMLANAQTTLYTEDFESNEAYSFDGYNVAFVPSTKTGTWSGGVDLETAGDADINLRQGWGEQFNLKILTTGGAAVTIPNIDVTGYTDLNLSYEFVLENAGGDPSVAVAPFIETSIDGGTTWETLATVASGAGWNKQQISIALPTGDYDAISLRLNANNVTAYDAMFDNLIITGTVTQTGNYYPSYNLSPQAPDETGVSSNAVELAAKMHLGINFGNTMVTPEEGEWNAKVTESYVQFVKQLGFNTVRLSVGWVWGHLSDPDKMEIDPVWLARVKEVVGWCVENDIYVIVNAHADLGWLEDNVTPEMEESVNAKQKALWEQIATTMRDFDEHLIFAGTNEPKADTPEQMAILNGYHETFINAVRSTGGKNSYRVLVVQGPYTDPHRTADLMTTFPADNIPNKLILEVHDYTPATFTILTEGDVSWGNMVYYWGAGNHSTIEPERNATGEEESLIDGEFQRIKENFVDKGIPVMLGEYGAWKRNAIDNANYLPQDLEKHNQSVDYWTGYVTKQAKANGIIPYYFETGFMLDRVNNVVKDQPLLDAIIAGATGSGGGTGTILREYWTEISGTAISDLTSNSNYPNNPTGSDQLTSLEAPTNWADNYGSRIRGYIHPSSSGTYTFWVAGDDDTELYLSTSDNPSSKTRIAYVNGWTNSKEWDKYSTQQSANVTLTAGQKYYIEVLHKDATGGDNIAVAWQGPGISQQVIGGSYLSPFDPGSIVVRARGTLGSETIDLRVNGNTIATWTLTSSYADYTASGSGTVSVHFTNDDGGRDVQVDYVIIGGTTYQSENQDDNTAVWQNNTCGGSNSEWLNCGGYISFATPESSSAKVGSTKSEILSDTDVVTKDINIYPNPARQGKFTLVLPEAAGNATINIFNYQGKMLYEKITDGAGKLEIESGLKTGFYLVRVRTEGSSFTRKLIVH